MGQKTLLKKILKKIHFHRKKKKDIYIFTIPRSGSTWLMDIINSQPGIKTVEEPLNTTKDNLIILSKYFNKDFIKRRYVSIGETEKKMMYKYFEDLSIGKTLNSMKYDIFKAGHSYITERTLFKTHKLTALIEYFDETFDIDMIYLIRHPISVSTSRIRNKWQHYINTYVEDINFVENLSGEQLRYIQKIKKSDKELEKFIVSWCLANFIFLKRLKEKRKFKNNFILVSYEEIVLHPEKVIRELGEKLNLKKEQLMLNQIKVPSFGTKYSGDVTEKNIINGNRNYLIEKWKKDVSDAQEKRIFDILNKFEIDFYQYKNFLPNSKYTN